MPYKSIKELPESVKVLPEEAQEDFIKIVNNALKQYNDDEEKAFAIAWSAIKKKWVKKGDKWVKKAAVEAAAAPLIIEGPAFPIGKKNKNGWGVPEEDVEHALKSLKTAVVRICPRTSDEHACDTTGDPKYEIGRVTDAWRDESTRMVRSQVTITDSVAAQKISEGTWENTWSVFGDAAAVNDGWTKDFTIGSLTLVRNPAWPEATFTITGSENGKGRLTMTFLSPFEQRENIGEHATEEGENEMVEGEGKEEKDLKYTQTQADQMISAAVKEAVEETLKGKVTEDEMKTQIAAAVEQAKTETAERIEKERLVASIAAKQLEAGVLKEEELPGHKETLMAMDLKSVRMLHAMAEKLTVKAAAEEKGGTGDFNFPGGGTGDDEARTIQAELYKIAGHGFEVK